MSKAVDSLASLVFPGAWLPSGGRTLKWLKVKQRDYRVGDVGGSRSGEPSVSRSATTPSADDT
jgi:hypothetical protein